MLLIFILSLSVHLYASWHKNKPLRDVSKPFLLLSLLGFYVYSVETIRWTIVLALVFSWIGDMFLILKGVKWFAIGGVSFMISHFFFILTYSRDVIFSNVPIAVIIILAIIFLIIVSFLFNKLKKFLPKPLFYPMYLYLLINGTMNCFAYFRLISIVDMAGIVTAIGAFLFFVSDCTLFFVRFDKNFILKSHFLVMLTYSIGELLIVLGLIIH